MKSFVRGFVFYSVALLLLGCGGGGGGGGGSGGGGTGAPSYSISVSQSSVALNGVTGGIAPDQTVVVNFRGDGVVVGTLPGQSMPSWLSVSAPTQSTSPVNVVIQGNTSATPGNYSTTLRFVSGKADGSAVVSSDVTVTFQLVPGQQIYASPHGVAQGKSVAVSLNNGAPRTLVYDQLNRLGVLAIGSTYTVSVPSHPTGQTCTFADGNSTTTGVLGNSILQLRLTCNASLIPWTWVGGSQTTGAAPVYGTRRTPAAGNTPGARVPAAYASDAAGNLWIFGGSNSIVGDRNDLWRYEIATGNWTWMSGANTTGSTAGIYGTLGVASAANMPSPRYGSVAWFDASGNFWLFGGGGVGATPGVSGFLNDLWMYDVAADMWTWKGGGNEVDLGAIGTYGSSPSTANIPGGRARGSVTKDSSGAVWFFGGYGLGDGNSFGLMNDLWKYNPVNGEWSWLGGGSSPNATTVPGTRGVPAAPNHPSARQGASLWADQSANIWVFGGSSPTSGYENDLWRFDPNTRLWAWMNGTELSNPSVPSSAGTYASPGTTTTNIPSARAFASSWTDSSGNLWLFGGDGQTEVTFQNTGLHNDLWKYAPATNTWLWLSGSNAQNSPGVYGTRGVASNTNLPSGRDGAAAWTDTSGRLLLWGGETVGGSPNLIDDVWRVVPQ